MNRFIMHPRFEFNLKQVKNGHKPYECYVVAGVLAYKIAKLCYSYGSGSDGEDRGVEETLYSMNGVNTDAISNFDPSSLGDLDLGNLDNIDTVAIGNDVDFSGLMSLDYPDLDDNDLLASDVSSGSDNGLTDGLTNGYAADGASGNSASNNYLVDFQSPQPFFETQTDGTVVSTDMFGMPHQWMDMDSALYNTDIMSGLPVESWASNSAASASGSVSFGGSDFTPRETEPDISFYQNQFDDASEKFLEYSEKLKWDEEHGKTDNIDFYRSQMNEAYRSMDYWERTGEMEYHSQKMDCIKTDAILNAADRASADLHATLEAMENRFKH